MMEKKIFFLLFRILCLIVFVNQVVVIMKEYKSQKPVTSVRNEKQEDFPLPIFCISTDEFNYKDFNTTTNITFDEYSRGKWRTNNMSEEELFDFLSPSLSNLVGKIKIANNTDPVGDSYETFKIIIQGDKYDEVIDFQIHLTCE